MNSKYVNYILAAEILNDFSKNNRGGGCDGMAEKLNAEYLRGRKDAIDELYVIAMNGTLDDVVEWLQENLIDEDAL